VPDLWRSAPLQTQKRKKKTSLKSPLKMKMGHKERVPSLRRSRNGHCAKERVYVGTPKPKERGKHPPYTNPQPATKKGEGVLQPLPLKAGQLSPSRIIMPYDSIDNTREDQEKRGGERKNQKNRLRPAESKHKGYRFSAYSRGGVQIIAKEDRSVRCRSKNFMVEESLFARAYGVPLSTARGGWGGLFGKRGICSVFGGTGCGRTGWKGFASRGHKS